MLDYIIAQILPKEDLYDNDDNLIPLGNNEVFDVVFSSIKNWVKKFKPSVLKEHKSDGESFGTVQYVFKQEDGIYALLDLNKEAKQKLKEKKLRYVSPGLHFNFKDNTGKINPVALMEVSLVSVPRFAVGQNDMLKLNKISNLSSQENINNVYMKSNNEFSYSALAGKNVTLSQNFKLNLKEDNMDMQEMLEMVGEMLEEKLDPLYKRLEELEKLDSEARDDDRDEEEETELACDTEELAQDEPAEEAMELEDSAEDDMATMKEKMKFMEEQLAEYKRMMEEKEEAELAMQKEKESRMAQEAVQVVLSQKKVDESAQDLLMKLYHNDKTEFDKYVSYLPNKKSVSKSVGFSQKSPDLPKLSPASVQKYAQENSLTYLDAYHKLSKS